MDANNYVAPEPGGNGQYNVVINGQIASTANNQADAQRVFNNLTGQSNAAASSSGTPAKTTTDSTTPTDMTDAQQKIMQALAGIGGFGSSLNEAAQYAAGFDWSGLLGQAIYNKNQLPAPGSPILKAQEDTGMVNINGQPTPTIEEQTLTGRDAQGNPTLTGTLQNANLTGNFQGMPTFASQQASGYIQQPNGTYLPTVSEQGVLSQVTNDILSANNSPANPFTYLAKLQGLQNLGPVASWLGGTMAGATGQSLGSLASQPTITNLQAAPGYFNQAVNGGSAFMPMLQNALSGNAPSSPYNQSIMTPQTQMSGTPLYDAQGNVTGYQQADGSISGQPQAQQMQQMGTPSYGNVDVPSGVRMSDIPTGPVNWAAGQKIYTDPNGYGFIETPRPAGDSRGPGADWVATGQQTGFKPASFNLAPQAGSSKTLGPTGATYQPGGIYNGQVNPLANTPGGQNYANPLNYPNHTFQQWSANGGTGQNGQPAWTSYLQSLQQPTQPGRAYAGGSPGGVPQGNYGGQQQANVPTGYGTSLQQFNNLRSPSLQGAYTDAVQNLGGQNPADFVAGMKAAAPQFQKSAYGGLGKIANF